MTNPLSSPNAYRPAPAAQRLAPLPEGPRGELPASSPEAPAGFGPDGFEAAGAPSPASPTASDSPGAGRRGDFYLLLADLHTLADWPATAPAARLGLALAGEGSFPAGLPYESLLDRAVRHSHPGPALVPGLEAAVAGAGAQTAEELLSLAERIFRALPADAADPAERGYAGLRLAMATAGALGSVRVSSLHEGPSGPPEAPLGDLFSDARADDPGRTATRAVERSFDELRALGVRNRENERMRRSAARNPVTLAAPEGQDPRPSGRVDTVLVGGVTLEVRLSGGS